MLLNGTLHIGGFGRSLVQNWGGWKKSVLCGDEGIWSVTVFTLSLTLP